MKPFLRTASKILLGLLVVVALVLSLAHTPAIRTKALNWAIRWLASNVAIDAQVGSLDYNLITGRVSLEHITLAASHEERLPFFEADAIRLRLPWSLTGPLVLNELALDSPRITITRRRDGSLNLPSSQASGGAVSRLSVDRLTVRELSVTYSDPEGQVAFDARHLSADLVRRSSAAIEGPLAAGAIASLTVGGQRTTTRRLAGRLAFDGANLSVSDAMVDMPEGRLESSGRIDRVLDRPLLDVAFSARTALESLRPWLALDIPVRGDVQVTGRARGPIASPTLTLSASSASVSWDRLQALVVRADADISPDAVIVRTVSATLAGGQIAGRGRIDLKSGGAREAHLEWKQLRASVLTSLATVATTVQPSASVDGRLDARWTSGEDVMLTLENASHALAVGPSLVPVDGSLTLTLDRDQWRADHRHRVGDSLEVSGIAHGRVGGDLNSATMNGDLQAGAADLAALGDTLVRARMVTPETWRSLAPHGEASARLRLSGTIGAPKANGEISSSRVVVYGLAPATLSAKVTVDRQRLQIAQLDVRAGADALKGSASVGFAHQTLEGQFAATLPAIDRLLPSVSAARRPVGALNIDARLGGTLAEPSIRGSLSGSHLAIAGQVVSSMTSEFRAEHGVVSLDRAVLAQAPTGRLSVDGRYTLANGRYTIRARGEQLEVRPLPAGAAGPNPVPVAGHLTLTFDGDGSLNEPAGRGHLSFSSLQWNGHDVAPAEADVVLDGKSARLTAAVPRLSLAMNSRSELRDPWRFDADARFADVDLESLVEMLSIEGGPVVQGRAAFTARASGQLNDIAAASIDVDVQSFSARVEDQSLELTAPARLQYTASEVSADKFEIRAGRTTLTMQGRLNRTGMGGLHIVAAGPVDDLRPLLRFAGGPPDVVLQGNIEARVDAVGSFDQPRVEGQLSLGAGRVQWPGLAAVSDITLQANVQQGVLRVHDLRGVWQGASATGTGELPMRLFARILPAAYVKTLPAAPVHGEFRARIADLTPAALSPLVSPETLAQIAGRATIAIEGQVDGTTLDRITGTATIEQANLSIARVPFAQEMPTTVTLADGRLVIPPSSWGGAGSRVSIGGTVSLNDPSPRVDLGAGGTVDLRLLSAFLSNISTSGAARVTLRAQGLLAKPAVEGTIDVVDGGLRLRDPRIAVAELAGSLHLTGDRLTVDALQGTMNGGRLAIAGSVGLDGYRPAAGRLTFTAREVPLNIPSGVRSQVDADLVFALEAPRPPELTGSISVLRGIYRERLSLTRQFLETGATESVVEGHEAVSLLDSTRLNVAIVTKDDVRMDNNYGRLELGADVRLVGTIAQPGLQGRATLGEGGRVFLGGNTYEIVHGVIDFTDATQIEPDLSVTARTRVSGYDVTLNVTGQRGAISANLTSDPPLGQDDLVSLLLTGRTLNQPGSVQATVARDQLLGLLSGELLGAAGRTVGLDTLRLERGLADEDLVRADPALIAGETDPSARLTLAKSFRRNMEFVLSRSLRESGGITIVASYRPRRTIELRAISRDNTDRSYEFRQDLSFGGGGAAQAPSSRASRQIRIVHAVVLTGTLGFPEQDLRGRLKLGPSDRFDFFRWQDDQDRLLEWFHDRGYLEARIVARRHDVTSAPDSGVDLEYEIARGPLTELAVDGYRLPNDVLSRMRQAWGLAVVDEYLFDELRRLARERLLDDGFPQATIDAAVQSTGPDAKRVVLTIAPGPHADARRLQFQGSLAVDSLALEAFVRAQGLERAAWVDPAVLERALGDYYRAHSRLAAAIKVGEPAFEGSTAVLPVTIAEGPAFRWSAIKVEGVAADRLEAVQKAIDVRVGEAYRPAALAVIRRTIEARYRSEGFNAVRIGIGAAIEQDSATVAMNVTVDEGRRQVLEAIQTIGALRTDEQFLADALRLDVGSAVDLTELYAARRRLYDTGAFRRADIDIEPLTPDAAANPSPGDEPVRARVTVEEVAPYRLRYGLQVNDELAPAADERQLGAGLTADLQRQNLWGRAVTAGLSFRYDRDNRIGRTFLTAPRFFGHNLTSTLFLSRSRELFNQEGFLSFVTDKTDITAEQRVRPRRNLEVAYSYRFERNRTFDPNRDPNDPLALDVKFHVARLNATTIFDTRDDPFDATRGWFHGSSVEYAPEVLGSDLRFAKYLLQQYYYHPLPGRLVLASAARLGLARGYGQDLIPSEKYFAGGGNSVRGYREDSIGGRDFFGDPIGGDALLVFNEEARFPIYGRFRGVGFLDAGNVYPSVSDLSLSDLKVGVGLGLRVNTPFALLRVDFGVPLSRQPGDRRARWFFSFGQMF